ncbi:MAG: Low-affinity inorganic phosphate transporter 1 [Chlamydiae bacterium]|nr:Low-affinity inorganic phosphate transporter 1 [Chlamydiota bacterium]
MTSETILLVLILVAGLYMAWNIGANDVANAMGTSVGSGALTLKQAVIIAAILEFSGAFFFGSHVSETVQKGIVDPDIFMQDPRTLVYGMFAALLATGVWLQLASYFGIPVSTTHSIVGSVIGFGTVAGGIHAVKWGNVGFIVSSWILSPVAGGIISYYLFYLLRRKIFYTYNPVDEAKKLAPILVFCVVTILSLLLLSNGTEAFHLKLSTFETLGICLLIGAMGSLIGYLFVRRIKAGPPILKPSPAYGSEITNSFGKARKHLKRIQSSSVGELNYRVSVLLDEIDNLSSTLQQDIEKEVSHSEYAVVEKIFGYLQILSACLMAFAHGANDVANAIGPLAAAVGALTTNVVTMQQSIPTWALALGGVGIVVGLATWGWRVIETIGKKITELTPTRGFTAEFGAAITILTASRLGMPISTTHTLVGAVIGVGLAKGIGALNLEMTRDIFISWVVTVPAGAILAVAFFYGIQFTFG